ncbi:N-acetylglucosamine-6-phosphate deacetylase [Fusobacterium polymorphum]|uniref:N-acetylglucosamine-6-phosphate deacetylase n=1 Tax=Fusobacterium nucleatum subsp. polymorphum TaxID=76857 RepID=A0A2C6BWD4_FUSNP|nr:N-acetylglucosamine-6-phosphate deacetylase [Fusobacterium polymorphum]PHI08513.1 N-acetylglucosamine-6-phosphate deacetylase [Fusobacterium polymorphum]
MKKILLKNANLVLENKLMSGSISIFENKIEKIFADNDNLSEITFDEIIDLEGKYLGPAFTDVHTHGADGSDAMDGSEEALRKISAYLVKEGTANFLATTLTSSKETLINVLKVVANLQDKDIEGANIFGVHMEGPYFAIEYKGAQNDKYMKPAGINELEEYLKVKDGLVKLFSISPHNQENLEAIKFLADRGVIVSVGHSGASYEAVMKAVDYGLSHATHTYNGMKGFTHREPGVVGAIFNSDNIMAEIIFDKIHVHPEAVRTLIRVKGVDKIVCVTDSMSATGLAEGQYKLGELDVNVKDGQARLASNNALAGSVLRMDIAFKNLIELGYSITDAFKMTSTNAAKEFKLNTGILKEGKDADLVVLDKDYKVYMTMVKGKIKYTKL